jgi:hypothetical protein
VAGVTPFLKSSGMISRTRDDRIGEKQRLDDVVRHKDDRHLSLGETS